MKIAARFPVKQSLGLALLLISLHGFMLVAAWLKFSFSWPMSVVFASLCLSGYFSGRQYLSLTQAPDDLCWTGENWLMQSCTSPKTTTYLKLMPFSWMSSFACVLHFTAAERSFSWLFTRAELGERSYSELTYLVKQNLLAQAKQ